jgi:Pyruvate/2-oxoacid:ferredoxin oxidoreductase gamma subunit
MDPIAAQHWVEEGLAKVFPLGVYRDRSKDAPARPAPAAPPTLEELPRILGLEEGTCGESRGSSDSGQTRLSARVQDTLDFSIKIAGFGGQGVLLFGEVLAESGLAADWQVSWLPSYGPEMRSGTSNCHVRISRKPIASPLVSRPNVLLALNEPSMRKFLPSVEPGGLVLYNGTACPEDCSRADVTMVAAAFTHIADELGGARATNMVMLGALMERARLPFEHEIESVLRKLVHSPKWLEIDLAAIARGRQAVAGVEHENLHTR